MALAFQLIDFCIEKTIQFGYLSKILIPCQLWYVRACFSGVILSLELIHTYLVPYSIVPVECILCVAVPSTVIPSMSKLSLWGFLTDCLKILFKYKNYSLLRNFIHFTVLSNRFWVFWNYFQGCQQKLGYLLQFVSLRRAASNFLSPV